MTEETLMLLVLVILMLVGSYISGNIPLVMRLSEEKLKFVTVLGAGLLVGTALTVIIPEGIRSLYTTEVLPATIQEIKRISATAAAVGAAVSDGAAVASKPLDQQAATQNGNEQRTHESFAQDHSRTIGLSLVLGFVFMMLVDQVSQRQSAANDKNITATLGLVVHAAADGVALGAAATTSHQDVEMIVFLAIMLHKAPAAFGLVSFLLHEKIERQQIRKHLAIFSLSAPLLTLLTYFGIGQEQKETLNSLNATGIAMLFSAGTFLYVATVHVLPELTQSGGGGGHHAHHHHHHHHHHQYDNVAYSTLENASNSDAVIASASKGSTATIAEHSTKGLRYSELFIMIFGALLPLVITFGHH